jgi:uncharacterized membrane protein
MQVIVAIVFLIFIGFHWKSWKKDKWNVVGQFGKWVLCFWLSFICSSATTILALVIWIILILCRFNLSFDSQGCTAIFTFLISFPIYYHFIKKNLHHFID